MTGRGGDEEAYHGELDLALSWSERDLPERERTSTSTGSIRTWARLFPGSSRRCSSGTSARADACRSFAGSGTTLVKALESGYDAVGVDIAAFNALLISVKTREHDLELLQRRCATPRRVSAPADERPTGFVRDWFAPQAAAELLQFRSLIPGYASQDVLRVVLTRRAPLPAA